jgi:hypothetical protein
MRHLLGTLVMIGMLISVTGRAATVLVTGADRGLGLEFVRQYAARAVAGAAQQRHGQ